MSFSSKFQFHKGSIKTVVGSVFIVNPSTFQFHKGSIKTNAQAGLTQANTISIP